MADAGGELVRLSRLEQTRILACDIEGHDLKIRHGLFAAEVGKGDIN